MTIPDAECSVVMAGLDPAIQLGTGQLAKSCRRTTLKLDSRVKPGYDADDDGSVVVRQNIVELTEFLESTEFLTDRNREAYQALISRFAATGLADAHFEAELTSGVREKFWQRMWEVILGGWARDVGLQPQSDDQGPDFQIDVGGTKAWMEAICPTASGLPEEWLTRDGVKSMPVNALKLKWTAAIREKRDRLEGSNEHSGYCPDVVRPDEPYVIAINSSAWVQAETGVSQFPYSAEVGLGIGPMAVTFRRDGTTGDPFHTQVLEVEKPSTNAHIDTALFYDEAYSGVSAVLSSGTLFPFRNWPDFTLVHNPYARAPLPKKVLPVQREYLTEDNSETVRITRVQ